jgi:hypothetical protein
MHDTTRYARNDEPNPPASVHMNTLVLFEFRSGPYPGARGLPWCWSAPRRLEPSRTPPNTGPRAVQRTPHCSAHSASRRTGASISAQAQRLIIITPPNCPPPSAIILPRIKHQGTVSRPMLLCSCGRFGSPFRVQCSNCVRFGVWGKIVAEPGMGGSLDSCI